MLWVRTIRLAHCLLVMLIHYLFTICCVIMMPSLKFLIPIIIERFCWNLLTSKFLLCPPPPPSPVLCVQWCAVYVCSMLCVCYVLVRVSVCICVKVHVEARGQLLVVLYSVTLSPWSSSSHWALSSLIWLGWLPNKLQGFSCLMMMDSSGSLPISFDFFVLEQVCLWALTLLSFPRDCVWYVRVKNRV